MQLMKLLKCFPAGTQVVVATDFVDGKWQYRTAAIETLKEGDLVLAREEYGPAVKLQRIEETFIRVSDHLRVLEFCDATGRTQTIKTTDEHPFWGQDQARFVVASELPLGTRVIGPNEEPQTLTASSREEFERGVLVYNFRVSEYHTYFVAQKVDDCPLLVHNAVKTYQSYTKTNSKTGQVYSGRTSGNGTPAENVVRRDSSHHMKAADGWKQAELDKSSTNQSAIRGREQNLIDHHGGAQSTGGTSGNVNNGISMRNRMRDHYLKQAKKI